MAMSRKTVFRKYIKWACFGIFSLLILAMFCLVMMAWKGKNDLHRDTKNSDIIVYQGETYTYNEDIINILCLGIDKKIEIEEQRENGTIGFCDAVFVVSIDTHQHLVYILAIPRDTMANVRMTNQMGKLLNSGNCSYVFSMPMARLQLKVVN